MMMIHMISGKLPIAYKVRAAFFGSIATSMVASLFLAVTLTMFLLYS